MDARQTVYSIITHLLAAQGREDIEIVDAAPIHDGGLGFDSLTTAEFSSLLEEKLGKDPYTAGQYPPTVAAVLAFYQ
jgi:acyl carrier protein